jgi:predicted nucleic acid-binding protein
MWVLCDNSTLSALAELDLIEVLYRILGPIAIPASVAAESGHQGAPEALKEWIANPPPWLTILPDPAEFLDETLVLGPGEAATITLAWLHRDSSYLVLDEKRGRTIAKSLGLRVTGLLAILTQAAIDGLLNFEDVLARLIATGFRLSPSLIEEARLRVKRGLES